MKIHNASLIQQIYPKSIIGILVKKEKFLDDV